MYRPERVLAIIVVAFGSWGLLCTINGSGLPLQHDELNFLIEGMRLPAEGRLVGYLHGPFLYEVMAAMEVAWFAIARVLGYVQTPADHLANLLASLAPHLKAGRFVTLASALICLIQIYRVGALLAGGWAGVAAALLCASALTFAVFSSLIKEDVFLWLFLLTAMDLVWRSSATEYRRPFLAGIAVGAAFTTKYFGVFGLTLALIPLIRGDRDTRSHGLAQAAALLAGSAVGISVLFPFLFFDLSHVLSSVATLSAATGTPDNDLAIWSYLSSHLPALLGGVVAAAAVAELGIRLKTDPRGPILLLLPAFFLFAFLATRRSYTISYHAFFVAIAGFLLAAALVVRVARLLPPRWRVIPMLVLFSIVLFDPAYLSSSIKYGLIITGPSTRQLAEKRVEALVPGNQCLVANGAVAGWNHFGPTISSTERSSSETVGTFASAQSAASARQAGPRYALIQAEMFSSAPVPPDCDWYVEAKLGQPSTLELAPLFAASGDSLEELHEFTAPAGFELVEKIEGFPEQHSIMYPYMTELDRAELRSIPVRRLWSRRKFGPSYQIYRRVQSHSEAAVHPISG